jgi:hypothetical protein
VLVERERPVGVAAADNAAGRQRLQHDVSLVEIEGLAVTGVIEIGRRARARGRVGRTSGLLSVVRRASVTVKDRPVVPVRDLGACGSDDVSAVAQAPLPVPGVRAYLPSRTHSCPGLGGRRRTARALAAYKAARGETWQPGKAAFLNARGKRWTRNAIAQHVIPPALEEAISQRAKAGAPRDRRSPRTRCATPASRRCSPPAPTRSTSPPRSGTRT